MGNTNLLKTRIILNNKPSSEWAQDIETIWYEGEFLVEDDTRKIKMGDGIHIYSELEYLFLTPDEVTELIEASKHTHSNKSILDATTASFTNELLSKLNGIVSGATKVEKSTTNGNVKINGTETNVYTHPTYQNHDSGLYKISIDNNGHVNDVQDVSKEDITALGLPAQDTTYEIFSGSDGESEGDSGLVPAPSAADSEKYLSGNGTWSNVSGSQVVQDENHRFVSDSEKSEWNNKASKDVATGSSDGLMSSSDKTKLGTIADGANKTVIDSALNSESENPVQNKVINAALSEKVPVTRTINGKELADNISLQAVDVGAIASSQMGASNGVATLDSTGKVPSAQLPSYVDDTIEGYLNENKFYQDEAHETEIPSESGKIYVDLHSENTYRWSGTTFVEISKSLALGETSSTAYAGDKGKVAYDHSQSLHARSDATKTEKSSTNGNIKINGSEFNVYTHPTYSPHDSGLYKIVVDASGHISSTSAVTKSDITNLGIPGQDTNTTYSAMKGASSTVAGESGLVPAPSAGSQDKFLKADGTWSSPVNTTYAVFGGATSEQAGSNGLVPGPSAGSANRFLRSDGTWSTTPNTTYDVATSSKDGLMSSEDKTKLDGVAVGANKYTHPSYTAKSSGLYKVTVDSTGHVSATTAVTKNDITALGIPASDTNTWVALKGATTSNAGTAGYAPAPTAGASNRYLRSDGTWSVPPDTNTTYANMTAATASAAGKAGLVPAPAAGAQTKYLRGDGTWQTPPDTNTTYGVATGSSNGLMAAADKTKLDGIATGANKYTHPAYTAKSSGLYKVTVDATGHVSAATAVTKADITGLGIPASDTNTWIAFKGATTSAAGTAGYAPAPSAGAANRYLRSDGTWAVPPDTNTTYTLSSFGITATASELNFMDGVTSNVQTQLNAKAPTSHSHSNYLTTSGTAAAATKLATARTISLSGDASGSTSFNGSANVSIAATVLRHGSTAITSNQNLNNFTDPGWYYCPANATVATLKNCPTTNAFALSVSQHAGTSQLLIEYVTSTPKMFMRNFYNSTWGPWYEVYHTGQKPTASEIGAAASSHNHSAANITSGTLAVARGGTGLASSPSILINLASTSAASVLTASPRPGVTGTLPVARGGTGGTTAATARTGIGAVNLICQASEPSQNTGDLWFKTV